jgi:hypothetical protein
MGLRAVVLAIVLCGPVFVAEVQSAGNVPTIGYLLAGPPQSKLGPRGEAFYQGLRDLVNCPPSAARAACLRHARRAGGHRVPERTCPLEPSQVEPSQVACYPRAQEARGRWSMSETRPARRSRAGR